MDFRLWVRTCSKFAEVLTCRGLPSTRLVAFVGFIVIHVSQVILTGLVNNLRSMITGWYRLPEEEQIHELRHIT